MRALALCAGFVLAVCAAACGAVIAVAWLFPASYLDVVAGVTAGWAAMNLLPDPPCPFPCCREKTCR